MSQLPILIGEAAAIVRAREIVAQVCNLDIPVAIHGPTGSGKEVIARHLHFGSHRAPQGAFIAHNCALPEDGALLESRFFGHERGAFTGALDRRLGLLEMAHSGTLFLDEAQEMPALVQALLLRVLEGHGQYRMGGQELLKIPFRLVLASNRPLETLVREGLLRRELYYRIRGVTIELPPLADREDDLFRLLEHFNVRNAERLKRSPLEFTKAALTALRRHSWPGNVRELAHEVERLHALATGDLVRVGDLADEIAVPRQEGETPLSRRVLYDHTHELLRKVGGDVARAAEILDVHPSTVRRRLVRNGGG